MDAFTYAATLAVISFAGFLLLRRFDPRLTIPLGLSFAAYIGLNDLATALPVEFPALRLNLLLRWNWFGQFFSILFSIATIFALGLTRKAVGLNLPERNIRIGLIAVVIVVLPSPIIGFLADLDPPTVSTLAFQALMPGIAEEIAYRGIAPAILLGLMYGREPPNSVPWTVIFIVAIPFAVVHGMGYSDGEFFFLIGTALHTLAGGIIYTWMRFFTGSLLFPILAHALGNLTYTLAGFI